MKPRVIHVPAFHFFAPKDSRGSPVFIRYHLLRPTEGHSMIRLTFLVVAFLLVAEAQGADWPQWLGPKRDGGTTETIEPWKDTPKELWRAKAGAGFSSPVVAGGRVFVHGKVSGKDQEELLALDAKTGTIVWRTPYD